MTNQFRVWCKNKNEWERDELALLSNGELYDVNRNVIVRKDTHIIEFATGIKDKNDKMIYEGDIIKHNYVDYLYEGAVSWDYSELQYAIYWEYVEQGEPLSCFYGSNLEVICNIHEGVE